MDASLGTGDLVSVGISVASAIIAMYGSLRIVETRLEHHRDLIKASEDGLDSLQKGHMELRQMHLENRERMQAILTEVQKNFVTAKHFDLVIAELKEDRKATNDRLDRLLELVSNR